MNSIAKILAVSAAILALGQRQSQSGQICTVNSPGDACGVTVTISPYLNEGGPFGGFQSDFGTSYQNEIEITFTPPVRWVSVTALDPDYKGNRIIAFSGKYQVDSVNFEFDNVPNQFSVSKKTVVGEGTISRIVLRPDAVDYVAYRDIVFEKMPR